MQLRAVSFAGSFVSGQSTARGQPSIQLRNTYGNHANHSINTEKWLRRTHKQVWRDAEPKFAYTLGEVIPEEPLAAFREFCRECNIVFTGQMGPVPVP